MKPAVNATIRPAAPADVPLILELVRELAEYERAPQDAKATPELLHAALFGNGFGRGPTCEALIAVVDGRGVGFAVYFMNFSTWLGKAGLYLEDLYVRPAARGHGVGKSLLTRLAVIARERGCQRMEWSVLDWNTPAIDFYTSLGATPMQEWTTFRMTTGAITALAEERQT